MDDSLRRTSEMGRELLERAGRRGEDWWSERPHSDRCPQISPGAGTPEEERSAILEEAFSTLSRIMRQTTELCERYHSRISTQMNNNSSEAQHISRFHCRKPQRAHERPPPAPSSAAAPLRSPGRTRDARDVYIEVAPGTYRISAASPDYQPQTHLVNVTPGQSVDLTFHV
ncbi:A-kinase-interacting protein 1 [Hyla sarda]|uniref:A-kinase-interacting protein 1 n=1 Tax=Hyla sarda TaxID=327740 RepID=UPI0024C29984|nr:A-kinase-interacting protein 1 [Hyla sarda]XP_056410354.1 A-kinase-interacting protein 1 [Hyla sarda]